MAVTPPADPTNAPVAAQDARQMRRIGLSVLIGTTIEWYDFLLYGAAAALIFGPLYFPSDSAVAGTLLAFSTFAVGFAARPVGGVVLGHFGDRIGRKRMLVLSLTLMGVATFLIGLLPTYETIGVAAPILLVALRILQGFGVGGEWGGAVLTAVEHARPGRQGFFGSLPQAGAPAGLLLSTLAFLAVSQLPEDVFLGWGWRIPFLLSAMLVGVGLYVRASIAETPAFREVASTDGPERLPILTALRSYPRQIVLATLAIVSSGAYFYVVNTYALAYATASGNFTRPQILGAVLASAALCFVAIPWCGHLSERFGRRTMISAGLVAMALWIFPLLAAIDSGSLLLVVLAYLVSALCYALSYGSFATFIAELFDARVRYSAASISFQLGVLLGGALAPIVATALVARTGGAWSVAVYVAVLSAVSLGAVLLVRRSDVVALIRR
ncbi:MFS transporter [Pseudonocardia broussonetiae]|nr:MFS transporter [Pseudonocardia broussonetiae]